MRDLVTIAALQVAGEEPERVAAVLFAESGLGDPADHAIVVAYTALLL